MKDYRGVGWRTCPRCGQLGYVYFRRGHYEVKHHPQIAELQQMTFVDSGLALTKKKQKTCYVPKGSHFFSRVFAGDKRLAQNRIPTPKKIAVFAGGTAQ